VTRATAAAWVLIVLLCPAPAAAEQPVFDEMPRWAGGWGVQALHEARQNGDDSDHWVHLEGVYTWRRWIRATVKLPWLVGPAGGLGRPTLALPLKRYFNLDGRSGSWTLTPEWTPPTPAPDRAQSQRQAGLTLAYSTETYGPLGGASIGFFRRIDTRLEAHLSGAAGFNLHGLGSSGHIKLKLSLLARPDGAHRLSIGPTLYWRLSDRWHAQLAAQQSVAAEDYAPRTSLRSGLAAVF
jgi:hypothetical protein